MYILHRFDYPVAIKLQCIWILEQQQVVLKKFQRKAFENNETKSFMDKNMTMHFWL